MKIKALDRLLLIVVTLALICLAVVSVLCVWLIIPKEYVLYFLDIVYNGLFNAVIVTIAALILFCVAVKLLFLRTHREAIPHNTTIRVTDIGAATISGAALESMVMREVRQNSRVRDCTCKLAMGEESVGIKIILSVLPGSNLIEVCDELQKNIKESIESLTGLKVNEVAVSIENTETAPKPVA